MTATTAPEFTTVAVRVGFSGRKIHRAMADANGARRATVCGAERRGVGVTATYVLDAPITCLACAPEAPAAVEVPEGVPAVIPSAEPFTAQLQAEAAAAHEASAAYAADREQIERDAARQARRAVPAAATREEVTATVPAEAPRYEAVRHQGRPGVLDRATGKVTQTRTKGIAEERAAKLNRQHEAEARITAAEDAVTAVYERAAAKRAAKDADAATVAASIQTQGDFLTEVGALLGGSSLRQRAAAARERTLIAREAAPAAPVPAPAPEAPTQPEAAAEKPAKLFSVWVGHRMADALMPLADTEPGTALGSIGGKLRDAKQGRRLARTIRLTPAEREALAGYATQTESDAVAGKDAPLADSARTLRGRLA